MYKRIVGAVSVVTLTVVTLGMGYPQENQNQVDNAIVDESATAMVELVENIDTTQLDAETTQEHGAICITEVAGAEAIIQDSEVPLAEFVIESTKRSTTISEEDKILFQQVVSAEARGESFEAQYSVACVILNRVESDKFPNTVREVITQKGQFSCVPNGNIYRAPITDSVVMAVDKALDNNTLDESVLWFRSDYYHRFCKEAFSIGRLFYSSL